MARRCGLARGVVWDYTPREWYRELVAWKAREERDHNQRTSHAWLVAKLSRAEKIPDVKKLLVGAAAESRPQTLEEQRNVLKVLSGRYGGTVREGVPRG